VLSGWDIVDQNVDVSGLSILTRKIVVTRMFGSDAWGHFFRDVARAERPFRSLITADTAVPLPAFLAFQDELMRRFFGADNDAYVKLGRESSRWALGEGPLKALAQGKDLESMVAALPGIHGRYLQGTTTRSEALLTGACIEFKVFDLPQWHPYFEHCIVGYVAEVLEMFCANPIQPVRVHGGSGKDYHYLFQCAPAADEPGVPAHEGRMRLTAEASRHLSDREFEVLRLVARGKTNEQIGAELGISKKTAQHHVAHACRKIRVTGRVGAALWLAERGLVGARGAAREIMR
jgi:DNA-binding CsgD family transcriptional regulator